MKPIEHYEQYGYVVLRSFLDDQEVSLINRHVDRIYQMWHSINETCIFENKLVNMHSLTSPEYFQDDPAQRVEFFKAIASNKLTKALDDLFGSGVYFHNTQLFFNPSNPERLPYWHRDMQYSPINDAVQCDEQANMVSLHVRIPLVKEQGLEVVTGTHIRWDTELERNVRFEAEGYKNSDSLPDSKLIDLVPGDVLIFNAQMIHRGNYQLNAVRKAFDLCVGKYHPLVSAFADPCVLPTEQEMQFMENNVWYKLAREYVAKSTT